MTTTLPHLETLFVKITKGNLTINAGVVYCPPNSCFQEFLLEFEKVIKALPKNILTYIIGDFNLNLLNSATNSEVEAFETLFLSEGLYPVISLITHQRKSKNGSCIGISLQIRSRILLTLGLLLTKEQLTHQSFH